MPPLASASNCSATDVVDCNPLQHVPGTKSQPHDGVTRFMRYSASHDLSGLLIGSIDFSLGVEHRSHAL
jgi:hypothetical protein